MAWDPPALFSVSEVVTAAKMNQIRDSLLYLKGQAGTIVPEAVISPVRNDAASSYTLERTSATARKYGLLVGASGDFGIDDLTAATRRLTIGSSGTLSIPGAIQGSSTIFTSGQALFNGFAASSIAALGVAQANCFGIYVAAEGITSSTVTLFSGITRGVGGPISAYGSTFGWSTIAANGTLGLAAASFNAGAFVVEITGGGVLQARRVSGSETWAVSCILNVR